MGRSRHTTMVNSIWDLSGLQRTGDESAVVEPSAQVTVHWFLWLTEYHFHYLCPSLINSNFYIYTVSVDQWFDFLGEFHEEDISQEQCMDNSSKNISVSRKTWIWRHECGLLFWLENGASMYTKKPVPRNSTLVYICCHGNNYDIQIMHKGHHLKSSQN